MLQYGNYGNSIFVARVVGHVRQAGHLGLIRIRVRSGLSHVRLNLDRNDYVLHDVHIRLF